MKNFIRHCSFIIAGCAFLIALAATLTACKQTSSSYRMSQVTYLVDGERISLSSEELKNLIEPNYVPRGGLEDNYFFIIELTDSTKGRAIFAFAELGDQFENVIADTFMIEKEGKNISLTFSKGAVLSGTQTRDKLIISGNGVEYEFTKI